MKKPGKTTLIKYGTSFLALALLAYSQLSSRVSGIGEFLELDTLMKYHYLCDAFSLPGFLFVMIGSLMGLNNLGALDALGYFAHYLMNTFVPSRSGKVMTYFDYVQDRREHKTRGFGFLFVTGGVFLIIGFVFLGLYYTVS